MNRYKCYYFLSIAFLVVTEFFGKSYRTYIYVNGIYDFGVADMYTNIGAVLVASFLFMGFAKKDNYKDEIIIILSAVLGFVLYEFIQLKIPYLVFDLKDIIGTFIGGIFTIIFHKLIFNRYNFVDTI